MSKNTKIIGYRELDQDTLELINKVKLHGQVLQELIQEVKLHFVGQRSAAMELEEPGATAMVLAQMNLSEPDRWAALARTHFQEGLMCLTRSLAQPIGF